MNNSIQNEAETQELRRETPFRSTLGDEANEGTITSVNDPDRVLSIIVLVLACVGLAVLAHVVV